MGCSSVVEYMLRIHKAMDSTTSINKEITRTNIPHIKLGDEGVHGSPLTRLLWLSRQAEEEKHPSPLRFPKPVASHDPKRVLSCFFPYCCLSSLSLSNSCFATETAGTSDHWPPQWLWGFTALWRVVRSMSALRAPEAGVGLISFSGCFW